MLVANDNQHAIPVREQNLDANGNIKVHEHGTADINVTNSSLSVAPPAPLTSGGGGQRLACPADEILPSPKTATVLSIHMDIGVELFGLGSSGNAVAAEFVGPAYEGNPSNILLPLPRAVQFNEIFCAGRGGVSLSWVGNQP
jgi:hypothetical protein